LIRRAAVILWLSALAGSMAYAQTPDDTRPGLTMPSKDWLQVRFDVLGADYQDFSQTQLGHESQGRIGWVIISLFGKVNEHVSYVAELNPVDDSARPKPACGETYFFYPNGPDAKGPPVTCVPDGRNRVDLYRFIGLDPLSQQGAVRRAVVDFHTTSGHLGLQAGRVILPLGFGWQDVGSWSNEDATLIQRLDAEASFGALIYARLLRHDRPFARLEVATVRGDGKRDVEYSYSAFVDSAEDTNSGVTTVARVSFTPLPGLDVRLSGKHGYSASKVERYASFYLTKRNDKAVIASAQYRPNRYVRGFAEYARYVSGLPDSSAQLIGLPPGEVIKPGYYMGADLTAPLPKGWEANVTVTHEDLSRNDSLVWYMASLGLYRVHLDARVRSTIVRWSVRPMRGLEVGAYLNLLDNPFPWLSGIVPVTGDGAFLPQSEGSRKLGVVFRLQIP
jgi:hypothetical protein